MLLSPISLDDDINISVELKSLILKCIKINPNERLPTGIIEDLLKDPWFTESLLTKYDITNQKYIIRDSNDTFEIEEIEEK